MFHRRGIRAATLVVALTAVLAVSSVTGSQTVSAESRTGDPGRSDVDWLDLAVSMASPLRPLIDSLEDSQAFGTGSDGRLTFVLLGSDARGSAVSRTDAMLIMSIKGNTITAASLPRDTGRVPRPASMGGGTFSGKANSILHQLQAGTTLDGALNKFDQVIENLAQIEVDYHALIWFNGFTTLVDKIDPVSVNSTREIRDGKAVDDPSGPHGVYFPQWNGYSLYAWDPLPNKYCNGAYKNDTNPPVDSQYWCHRALPYVRSRKGPNNDDWVRARRQQEFIASTIKAVSSSELNGLVNTAQSEGSGKWWTNFPISAGNALDLYNKLHGANLGAHVVWKPSQFAARIPGTSSYELKLTAVRQWSAQYLN
jgi:anionic cell wall polymer biosynthesis LytR-Cps2A-Psr (LCP) family protein